jgi:hypothetical protein
VEKEFVARKVATQLHKAEAALDEAMVEVTAVLAAIVEARRELGLAATVGAEASARITDAVTALGQARSALVAGHEDLAVVQRALHIPATAIHPGKKLVIGSAERRLAG